MSHSKKRLLAAAAATIVIVAVPTTTLVATGAQTGFAVACQGSGGGCTG